MTLNLNILQRIRNVNQPQLEELSSLSITQNVPNVDYSVDKPPAQPQTGTDPKHDNSVVKTPAQTQVGIDPKYNLRRFIKPPTYWTFETFFS